MPRISIGERRAVLCALRPYEAHGWKFSLALGSVVAHLPPNQWVVLNCRRELFQNFGDDTLEYVDWEYRGKGWFDQLISDLQLCLDCATDFNIPETRS